MSFIKKFMVSSEIGVSRSMANRKIVGDKNGSFAQTRTLFIVGTYGHNHSNSYLRFCFVLPFKQRCISGELVEHYIELA